MRGAGGTGGGIGQFFLGLVMMAGGGYLFFNAIHVTYGFSFSRALFNMGGFGITSGMIMIPFIFGVGIIFYNAKNWIGWILALGSLVALGFGVIASINFRLARMTAFDLIVILVLLVGGIGLFLRSLKGMSALEDELDYRERRKRY